MGQSITIDVQAKIVGYEQSIKQMQQALQKIDPGSELGQKISKALQSAQKQVYDLGKNMFPKASTDAQVDSIVERVNRVGNALQNVSSMFQGLNMGDLNFNALGQEFQSLQTHVNSLSSELDSKINQGLVNAVSNSTELKSIFSELGTDMSKATTTTLFDDLAKGAAQASKEAEQAKQAYNDVTEAINKKNSDIAKVEASPIGTEQKAAGIRAEVESLSQQYDSVMSQLRDKMSQSLTSKLAGSGLDPNTFLDQFFSGLTPDTLSDKIGKLFDSLKTAHIYKPGEKRNFYEQIFGESVRDVNGLIQALHLDQDIGPIKDRLTDILSSVGSSFKLTDALDIQKLIDSGDLQNAFKSLQSNLDKAINDTARKVANLKQQLDDLENKRTTTENAVRTTTANSDRYNNAQNDLKAELEAALKKNIQLQQDLEEARNLLQAEGDRQLQGIHNLGSRAGISAGGAKFPIAEANQYKEAISQIQSREQMLGKAQGLVQRYFSLYAAIRMVSKGFRQMMSTIKELDSTITEIAIVTNKTQPELWDQMPQYTKLARDYAASISGVYKVSQLYYQQGLGQSDVMALTEQTLKMARISGLDYAQATDYMTNAVRSFKMEMTDAQTVVDTYSAVAAKSATSVSELATAMSKTASSAQSVGADIQTTTAMMAVMIEATRESPENIGSAMKSIISRYGELKENKTGMDEEGEEYSLNKVDTALQSVGISIHDANGEFRDFDDVIMELADSWDTIDKNTQRYIATVMAGNRQQSRFLALVSSGARLRELVSEATESQDAAQLQFLKTLDSVDAKTQQLQNSIQSLYVNSGLEDTYKNVLDLSNNIVASLDNLAQNNGLTMALTKIGTTFSTAALLVSNLFNTIKTRYASARMGMVAESKAAAEQEIQNQRVLQLKSQGEFNLSERLKTDTVFQESKERQKAYEQEAASARAGAKMPKSITRGMALSGVGMAMTTIGASLEDNKDTRPWKAGLTGVGGILSGVGTGMMVGGPAGILMGIVTAIPNIIEAFGLLSQSTEEKVSELEKSVDDANNARIESRSELKTLEDYKKKYDELSAAQYDSNEKKQEFIKLQNEIAERYPELIKGMTSEGDYLVNMAEGYERLAEAKRSAYKEDIVESIAAETAGIKDADYVLQNIYGQTPIQNTKAWHGLFDTSAAAQLMQMDYAQFSGKERNQVYDALKNKETANQIFSNLKTAEGTPVDFMSIDDDLAIHLFTVYSSFIDKIKENKSYAQAADEIEAELGESYKTWIDAFSPEVFKELKTRTNIPEYQSQLLESQTNAYHTELVNLLANQTEETFDIASNDIQKRFAQEQMSRDFAEWEKNLDEKTKSDPEKWKEAVKDFYAKYDSVWYKLERESEYMTGITDEQNQFYQQLGQHTEADLEKMFPLQDTTELKGEELKAAEAINKRNDFIKKIFEKDYDSILKDYDEWMETDDVKNFGVENYRNKFGPEFLKQIQSLYSGILSNEKMGDAQKQLQIQALNNINNILASDIFTFDERNALLGKVSAADLTSLNGIYSLIEGIGKLELDGDTTGLIEGLKNLGQLLSINLSTEIDTYYDTIEKSVDDFNKAVNSVTQGTDLKTARSIADKMGKSLNEFEVRNGKFYFDDIDVLREAYIKSNDEYIADVKSNIKDRYQGLEKLSEISVDENTKLKVSGKDILSGKYELKDLENLLSTEKAKLAFQQETGISASDFLQYYEDFQAQLDTGTNDFVEFMLNEVDSKLSESGEAILKYLQQNTKVSAKSQLKSGDIVGFLKTTGIMKSSDKLKEESQKLVQEDAQQIAEAQRRAQAAKEEYQQQIADQLLPDDVSQIAADIYKAGVGEGQAFDRDIRKRAEELAEAAKQSNEYAMQSFPGKSEVLQSYTDVALKDIKEAYAKEGKSAMTLSEIRAEMVQTAKENAIVNAQITSDFIRSNQHLSESAQAYIDNGEAFNSLIDTFAKDENGQLTHKKYSTEAKREAEFAEWLSHNQNADYRAQDEWYTEYNKTHQIIDENNEVVQEWAQHMAENAKNINTQRLNKLLKNTDVDSLTRKAVREFEEAGNHIIDDEEVTDRAVEYAREAKKLNDAWLEKNLQETDPNKIYDTLAEKYTGIMTDEEIQAEATRQANINAQKNKELQETILQTMNPEYWMEKASEEIQKELEQAQIDAYSELINQIGRGDISNLPKELSEYEADIYEIGGQVQSSILNSMVSSLEGGSDKIKVTAENKVSLQAYQQMGLIKRREKRDENGKVMTDSNGFILWESLEEGNLADINVEAFQNMQDQQFYNLVNSLTTDAKSKSDLISKFLSTKYKDKVSSTSNLSEKTSLTREEFQNHLQNMGKSIDELNDPQKMKELADLYGLTWNNATASYQVLSEDYDKYMNQLEQDLKDAETSEAKTAAQQKINSAKRKHKNDKVSKQAKAFEDAIKNYTNVSDDQIDSLQDSLGDNWEIIEDYMTPTGTGTYKLDIGRLKSDLDKLGLVPEMQELILGMFSNVTDDYLKNITTATSMVTQGTTNQADIQKFIAGAKQLGVDAESAFSYDSILNAWTLNATTMGKYVQAQAQQLVDDGLLSAEEVNSYVQKNVTQALVGAVDIKSYLDAENKQGQARQKLAKQLLSAGLINGKTQKELTATEADLMITTIEQGGMAAVNIMQQIATVAGKELTSAEIESAYRAQVSQITSAFDQLITGPGGIVTGSAKQILETLQKQGKASITALDANTAVINSITDIGTAYQEYYIQLAKSGEATLEELNTAMGKVLETRGEKAREQQAIDTLSDAAGMTYSTFSQLLTDMGIQLTVPLMDELEKAGITEAMGGNKMRIKDFAAFARRMNWDFNSEEYLSAFSSFNDGLVEQNKKNRTQAADELDKLKEVKPGDWLNLTQTTQELKEQLSGEEFTKLQKDLMEYGSVLDDGVLKLTENANLLGIADTLRNSALAAGNKMTDQLADMVDSIVSSYTDAITKGIEGGMTNAEKSDLVKKGADMGVSLTDKDFYQSAEGWQMTTNAGMRFYDVMTNKDIRSRKKIYNVLSKTLKETNKSYETSSAMLGRMNQLNKDLLKLQSNRNNSESEYAKQLRGELQLMREMYANSLSHKDDSWNFLSQNPFPEGMENALNYWQNWGNFAYQAGQWGMKQQVDDMEVFSAALKQAFEMSEALGHSVSFMGKQIGGENGYTYGDYLSNFVNLATWNPKTGKYESSAATLAKEGFNLFLGSEGWDQAAVKEFTKRNAEIVETFEAFGESMIGLQKTLNSYEQKGNKHTFEDFVDENLGFDRQGFMQQMGQNEKVLKKFNEFAKKVKINGDNLYNIMNGPNKYISENNENFKAIRGLIKAAEQDSIDLEHSYQAVAEVLSNNGFEGEIELYDTKYNIRQGRALFRAKNDESWTGPDGKTYKNINEAWDAYNKQDLDDLTSSLNQYSQTQSDNGRYTIELGKQSYNLKIAKGTGKIIDEATGKTYNNEAEWRQSLYEDYSASVKGHKPISQEAWWNQQTGRTFGEFNGTMSQATRAAMQEAGLTSQELIQNEWKNMVSQYGKEGAVAEWEAKYKFTPTLENDKEISDTVGKQLADAVNTDETANSVSKGIQMALGSALEQGGTINENGIPIKVKPEFESKNPFEGELFKVKVELEPVSDEIKSPTTSSKKQVSSDNGTQQGTNIEKTTTNTITVTPVIEGTVEAEGQAKLSPEVVGEIPEVKGIATYSGVFPASAPTVYGRAIYLGQFPQGGGKGPLNPSLGGATGTIGLAHAKSTLMGELGPEMVVSNGRYFVVGQNGPEFVDLDKDAIVFNHLQTKSLLEKGTSSTRGKAITNERNAVSYAHGNVSGGPAKDNGSYSDWTDQWRYSATAWRDGDKTLGDVGTAGKEAEEALESFIKELDKWYNYLQEIARLEEKITYQEQLRSKINSDLVKNGSAYYKSLRQSVIDLNDELEVNQALVIAQQNELKTRVAQLSNGPFGAIYKLDENGQVKYKDNNVREQFLAEFGQNDDNSPEDTSKNQYEWLKRQGFEDYMKWDKSGKEIQFKDKEGNENVASYKTAVQAFWDRLDAQLNEVQGLVDSVNEHEQAVLEAQEKQNELVKEMQDNQMELENQVLDAIVDIRERAIKELEDEKEAYQESADKMINGLNEALNNEREMYEMQEDQAETDRMRRRLAILLSSNGSASEITDLQQQIRQRDKDMYFNEQQQQIDAIKEASDLEVERLDQQIAIQNEILAYQKEHGLLWNDVYNIMNSEDPNKIAAIITQENSKFWADSPMKQKEDMQNAIFNADKWNEYKNDLNGNFGSGDDAISAKVKAIYESLLENNGMKEWENYVAAVKQATGEDISGDTELYNAYMAKYKELADPNAAKDAAQAILDQRVAAQAAQAAAAAAESSGSSGGSSGGGDSGGSPGSGKQQTEWIYNKTAYNTKDEALKARAYDYNLQINSANTPGIPAEAAKALQDKAAETKADYPKEQPKGTLAKEQKSKETTSNKKITISKQKIKATGNAFAKGTLLGELGPEAFVSGGRFHIAGKSGAEFVNLPDDAIVFNHAQTARLLQTGHTSRGDALNESKAIGDDIRSSYIKNFWSSVDQNKATMNATNAQAYMGDSSSALGQIINTDGGVIIEHAEVNMNVEQIANDYDAKRAGEQALEEMLRIARKNSVTSVRR